MTTSATGVVGYLNMLPFFFDEPGACFVAKSPAELNGRIVSGQIAAACISNIAGISNGLELLEPVMGVACLGPVKSVYLEPIINTESEIPFWEKFVQRNASSNSDLKKYLAELDSSATRCAKETSIQNEDRNDFDIEIFTSGASEQSLWLSRVLFSLQGFASKVTTFDRADTIAPNNLRSLPSLTMPKVLLSIGDPALKRISKFPNEPRLDLSQLWYERTGLPCVFAAWYVSNAKVTGQDSLFSETKRRMQSVLRWNALSKDLRKIAIQNFFEPALSSQDELDEHCKYLANIRHLFEDGEMKCLELFKRLRGF